ncbi:hypothetical protein ACOMICROBIO_EPCKBFOG_04029 [Vibrio sp. B1FLJ16]|uniref:hypothetical protein n=1 Tax=Vibrio sp. B1FLJ16 TaxID=2751178 RepID=UPI001AF78ED9|nr:hypothetical protein [Vibrio sp. B1FLJ16]CAD7821279.1 hypothetical protein ACOMICROBIO_EPCKBFOG_04029 [Vibrio sp. B1FLJ16]CAE6945798.1 hypothetical protein ACOMICROBIO_EPCKBFOG_04029 [Vibrio sp. B1FLJ16]
MKTHTHKVHIALLVSNHSNPKVLLVRLYKSALEKSDKTAVILTKMVREPSLLPLFVLQEGYLTLVRDEKVEIIQFLTQLGAKRTALTGLNYPELRLFSKR